MERRFRVALLTAGILLTTVGAPAAGILSGVVAGFAAGMVSLAITWGACVCCWGVARRPRPFRLVVAPVIQLVSAVFVSTFGGVLVDRTPFSAEWLAAAAAWLLLAAMFTFASVLFAGFLRKRATRKTHPGQTPSGMRSTCQAAEHASRVTSKATRGFVRNE